MLAMAQHSEVNFALGGAPRMASLGPFSLPRSAPGYLARDLAGTRRPGGPLEQHRPVADHRGGRGRGRARQRRLRETADACEPLVGFTAGNIALIRSRQDIGFGSCHLVNVVARAEAAGASAVLLVDPPTNHGLNFGTIPVEHDDGPGRCAAGLAARDRDLVQRTERHGALDNGLVAYEYGHAVGFQARRRTVGHDASPTTGAQQGWPTSSRL